MLKTGNIIDLKITDLAFGGNGLGRCDGKVIFVPAVLPGEAVRIEIVSDRKNFSVGKLIDITEKSEDRIEPHCPLALRASPKNTAFCPGCSYQHVSYKKELELKNRQFADFISKACKNICSAPAITAPVASPEFMNYRNKIVLNLYSEDILFRLGYHMEDNKTIIDIPECPLARKEINALLSEKRADKRYLSRFQSGTKITFRHTFRDGAFCWNDRNYPDERLLIEDTVLGPVSVPKGGFFQINTACMNKLILTIQDIINITKPDFVIDLYCGVGIFSLAAAGKVSRVTGIDCDKGAINTAVSNSRSHGFSNCSFFSGDASVLADNELKKNDPSKTLLILDPPRTGLDKRLIGTIEKAKINSIVYISCGPDTLGRDLNLLLSRGYRIKQTGLIDMFPKTYHFESLTHLERI